MSAIRTIGTRLTLADGAAGVAAGEKLNFSIRVLRGVSGGKIRFLLRASSDDLVQRISILTSRLF